MTRLLLTTALAATLAACSDAPGQARSQAQPGAPEETRPSNTPTQRPAFAGQTRAPRLTTATAYQIGAFASGLVRPWGIAFLPDGRALVTERGGTLRIVGRDGTLSPAVQGLPAVASGGQLGLFGLALDPAFASNRRIYMAFAAPAPEGAALSIVRGQLSEAGNTATLTDSKVIFRATPAVGGKANIGGRLVFLPDGTLILTVGDRFRTRDMAQTLDNHLGKVVRLTVDGAPAPGNPFIGKPGAKPEIWSYGHRNSLSAAINPWTGQLWTVEHGARGGDELNIPTAGKNYGWPVITYGEDYSGAPIGAGITQQVGLEQPVYYWDPVIAPSGMAFYDADLFPAWKGSLFIGGLAGERISRLTLKGDTVVGEEWLLTDQKARIRDVVVGPDGALYALTDSDQGQVLKITPK